MAPLSADRNTVFEPQGDIAQHPVAATTQIYLGSLVMLNSSGYAIPGANTAGARFVGVAEQAADNNPGSAGDIEVQVRRHGIAIFAASGLTVADVGKPLWISDDQTVTLTAGNVYVGKLAYFISATEAPVDLDAAQAGSSEGQLVGANDVVVTAYLTGTIPETSTLMRKFKMGQKLKVKRIFVDATTAPGSGKTTTVTVTEGTNPKTVQLADAAVHAEDLAVDQEYAAAAEISINVINSSGSSGAGVSVLILGEFVA